MERELRGGEANLESDFFDLFATWAYYAEDQQEDDYQEQQQNTTERKASQANTQSHNERDIGTRAACAH